MAINMPAIADPMKSEAYERERKKVEGVNKEEDANKTKKSSYPMLQGEGKIGTYKESKKRKTRRQYYASSHGFCRI